MSRARQAAWALGLATGFAAFGCSGEPEKPRQSQRTRPLVCTTLYPIHFMAERIAGELRDRIDLECVIPAGVDPLHWRPDDAAIQRMQSADLLLLNGADAERWAFTLSLPSSRTLRTAKAFKKTFLVSEGVTHSHGSGETHTHHGIDPFTWMDPRNASVQAEEIATGLQRLLPDHEEQLRQNYLALSRQLEALGKELDALGARPDGGAIVGAQPVYGYLARRLGWQMVDLDLNAAVAPIDLDLEQARAQLGGVTARILLWDREPVAEWRRALEQLGARGVVFEPCTAQPAAGGPDYLAAMRANVARLRDAW